MNNNEKVRFSSFAYPSLSTVFIFGGALLNIDLIIDFPPSTSTPCQDCYTLSSDINVYIDPLSASNILLLNLILLSSLCLSFLIFVLLMKRCMNNKKHYGSTGGSQRQDDLFQTNEKGMLMRNGELWGGDVFSSDLDLEELEWGEEAFSRNVELRQIT